MTLTQKSKWEGVTCNFCIAVAAATIGSGFQHGYNTGIVNAPKEVIEKWISEAHLERYGEAMSQDALTQIWSWFVSVFCLGGMIGGLSTAVVAQKFGRKRGLLANNSLALVGGVLQGLSKTSGSVGMLIVGRLFMGLNCGLNAGLAPMYLTEISPTSLRGSAGSIYQLGITVSILAAQVIGSEFVLGTAAAWPWALAITVLPSFFQLMVLPFCPESPQHTLASNGSPEDVHKAISWLRGPKNVEHDIIELKAEHEAAQQTSRVTVSMLFSNRALRMPLIISIVMMFAQQFSGINAAFYFSTDIFQDAGMAEKSAQLATMGVGVVNVLMTVVSVILVEKAGRKTLMMIGMSGMATTALLLTVGLSLQKMAAWLGYATVVLVIVFVVFFATGPGSIPWFIVNELFNQSARPTAASIAVAINWIANFIVGIGFLPLKNVLGPYVFMLFAGILVLIIIFTWRNVPETKGKPIEEITAGFEKH